MLFDRYLTIGGVSTWRAPHEPLAMPARVALGGIDAEPPTELHLGRKIRA
jgi:hypothetical protein